MRRFAQLQSILHAEWYKHQPMYDCIRVCCNELSAVTIKVTPAAFRDQSEQLLHTVATHSLVDTPFNAVPTA